MIALKHSVAKRPSWTVTHSRRSSLTSFNHSCQEMTHQVKAFHPANFSHFLVACASDLQPAPWQLCVFCRSRMHFFCQWKLKLASGKLWQLLIFSNPKGFAGPQSKLLQRECLLHLSASFFFLLLFHRCLV